MSFEDAFKKLAAAEDAFMNTEFMSPVMRGKRVIVKIDNIVMQMKVSPKDFSGWGIFKPTSIKKAKFVREPTMREKREYMKLFPVVRVILCSRDDDNWFGLPSNQTDDARFQIKGLVPVVFPEEVQMFETIRTRFDGANFWYDGKDRSTPAAIAVYLREELSKLTDVEKISMPNLNVRQKRAYAIALLRMIEEQKDKHEEKLRHAIEAAGAEFKSYVERGNSYTVEYMVDGQQHRSTVDKDTLEVQSAGICLTDHRTGQAHDKKFDLRSLVGVIREGIDRRKIVRVGENYGYDDDDDYDDYDD